MPSFNMIEQGLNGGHVLKLNKVSLFARKPMNINVSRSAAPKLARVPACRYNCDVKKSYINVCVQFHKD